MSLGLYTRWAALRAVDLVNLFADEGDNVTSTQLFDLLQRYSLPERDLDARAFAGLAAQIRHIFLDDDDAIRIERLNAMLDRFRPTPRIVQHDGHAPHFHYVTSDGPGVDHVGSSFAMALANAVVDESAERFGWCAAPACDHLFFDRSRNRSQRFCSKNCATRVHVRAHRARG